MEKVDQSAAPLALVLQSSSTIKRIAKLKLVHEQVTGSDCAELDLPSIVLVLFATYPTYQDRASREQVRRCIEAILRTAPALVAEFVRLLKLETGKRWLAPSSVFVLVEWCCLILQICSTDTAKWKTIQAEIFPSLAQALELLWAEDARESLKKSATILTRRIIRRLLQVGEPRGEAVEAAVKQLSRKNGLGSRAAVLLGVIAGVLARLPGNRDNFEGKRSNGVTHFHREALETVKEEFISFWVREIIGSRSPIPCHIATSFHDFFANFVSLEDIEQELVGAIEKAMLRSPEVVLNGPVRSMVLATPSKFDFSKILANRLMKPLLANFKSTNAGVRASASSVFCVLLRRSRDDTMVDKIMNELLIQLSNSKVTTTEIRVLYANVLLEISPSTARSQEICAGLVPLVSKEPNEAAIAAESLALTKHLTYLMLNATDLLENLTGPFENGLADKRVSVQRIWCLRTGEILQSLETSRNSKPHVVRFLERILPKLLGIFSEVVNNPIPAAQSGLIVGAYVTVNFYDLFVDMISTSSAKTLIQKSNVLNQALSAGAKPSFLLNHKAFSKITAEEDLVWLVQSLSSCARKFNTASIESTSSAAWMQAFLFTILSSHSSFRVQKQALKYLGDAYAVSPSDISQIVIRGLWTWFHNLEQNVKDSAAIYAQTGLGKAYLIIHAILPRKLSLKDNSRCVEIKVLKEQLINMLVLCRPEVLPRTNWIETCLGVGQDPGELVAESPERCIKQINTLLSDDCIYGVPTKTIKAAVFNTYAELAFVARETITTIIVDQIVKDLAVAELSKYGPTDFAIARTEEGTTFVDILALKGPIETLDKGSSNYETLKWEADIRAQLAAKSGQQKKLTTDEQSRFTAQLAKEERIRENVLRLESRLQRSIGIIHSLAIGPPTDADIWMSPSTKALLDLVEAGVGLLVGDGADKAYIACANLVNSRLGTLRPFIGVATLRALGSTSLDSDLTKEPLGELIVRILYKLRLAGEQRPFDSVSLSYMIPLMCAILQKHGIGQADNDGADEQITLALEFISFHTDTFSNISLPRKSMIAVLIHSMQSYTQHYKLIKDCLVDLCRAIASTIDTEEKGILLKGVIVPQISVRAAVLHAVREEIDLTDLDFSEEIWLASHDDVEENAQLSNAIWEENALEVQAKDCFKILPYLESADKQLRRATARAIATCVALDVTVFSEIIQKLEGEYHEKAKPRVPERDAYGMIKKQNLKDPWEARSGVALAFKELAPLWPALELVSFIQFLIESNALGDKNNSVREEMIDSATAVVSIHGAEKLEELMAMFENVLVASGKDAGHSDLFNEAVVILYGALGQHLKKGDSRVPKVVRRLLQTLSTPSETVQYAVAGCLPPLIWTSVEKTSEYVEDTLSQLFQSPKYATRRGAAYGIAGIVRGKGIAALREYRIMASLKSSIDSKKDQNRRQGALFAYELLSLILGRTFEPYVIQIVPQLIASFGDTSSEVREACLDASKTCFSNLSSYGVKLILPTLLDGLEESQWRSKKGACDLLGAMAYLDPQQLAQSLPDIIPPLTNVLNDSHKEVRMAANRSLQRFGEVISNPEIKSLVGILLKALSDPTRHTDEALDSLIKVSFVHYLDAPSLALVVRILERGLSDRSATKRKSAQIIGSLAHLTERKDLTSHLPILVAGLRVAVVDPVPATRATSSKALGSLIEKLGEDALPDLIPSLMATLRSDTGAGDRLGSAQALSEVLAGLGTGRLEETLPTILQNVSSSKPTVREGFMSLFIFLPACFGNSFANYLSKIIPPILAGLADEIESIRETSLRAGRLLVKNFATKAIDLLLPELDRGLADDSHRIRLSSVELVGDLLFNLTGISGTAEQDEDESGAAEAGQSLLEVLGEEKRNKILSSLYICRCDTSGLVRSASINVWKALVATPRTLKELIPTLTQSIIKRLASSNMEQKVIAGNALGELIRKAGEGVLATLLPTLEEGLRTSTDVDNKQGICIALREIISSASQETLEDYEKTLISVVRAALVDSDDDVRDTAAEAFDSLQQMFGKRAVDQVLPYLLSLLRTEGEADTALSALLTLLTDNTRSNIILPNLIPTLLTSPITSFNAKAIASLAEVASTAMSRKLPAILNALMDNIIPCEDEELKGDLETSFDTILRSLDEYDGLNTAMSVMLALVKHDDHRRRANASIRLAKFFAHSNIDYSRYNQDLIRVLLLSFSDHDHEVVEAAWTALSELTKRLRKEEMETLVQSTRQTVRQTGVAGYDLPGFSLPKGINAVLPIFLQGLMNGTTEQRTQAALGISDIIDRTSTSGLKPFVTNITGPLIRVVSERSVDLKAAILLALNNLLVKIPQFLKPFLPQLQRTFAKSLADPSSDVLRSRAAKALGTLLLLKPRVDPLIAELVTGAKTQDPGVRNSMLRALYEVVNKVGENMSETSRNSILGLIDSDPGAGNDLMVITNAKLFGALIKVLPAADANVLVKQRALTMKFSYASSLAINSILLNSPASLFTQFSQETPSSICQGMFAKPESISDNYVLAAGKYLLRLGNEVAFEASKSIFEALGEIIRPGTPTDTRRLALVVVRTVSRRHSDIVRPHLAVLTQSIFSSLRDVVIPVKLAAEAAFLSMFDVVESETTVFEKYMAGPGSELNSTTKKSMQDYFKRVAMRLAAQARERHEAEGGQGGLGLSSDEADDEREIWSIGKVELKDVFAEE